MKSRAAAGRFSPFTIAFPAMAAAAALLFILPAALPGRDAATVFLLAAAPAAAIAASLMACRAVPGAIGRPWLVFALAAALALAGQTLARTPATALSAAPLLLNFLSMAAVAAGIAWVLHQRDRERVLEIVLDAGLILAAASVVTLRWAPAAAGVLADAAGYSLAHGIAILGAPIATGCAFLFGTVLLLVRGGSPAGRTAFAIAAATLAFGFAVAPVALGTGACCAPGGVSGLASILGWLALAYAGVRAAHVGARTFVSAGIDAGGSRLRLVVAPSVALVMGAVIVDATWHGPLHSATAAVLGGLGLLLAVRVTQLLVATRTHSEDRIKLVQSRALIEVSHALASTRELDETLDLVSSWAVELLGARAAAIELLTADGRLLEVRAIRGLPASFLHRRFALDESLSGWVVRSGRPRTAQDSSRTRLAHPASAAFPVNVPVAVAPLRYRDATLGVLSCVGRYPFGPADVELLCAFAEQAAVAIENARMFKEINQLSLTDPLTGLANRRQLTRDLSREFAAANRGRKLVAVMFDLNGFKAFNDRFGHVAGDEALQAFANALVAETRAMNTASRYGGDEFVVLLADGTEAGAEVFIERVRNRFPGGAVDERMRMLSVAAGCAAYHPGMQEPAELIAAADRALYQDKAHSVRTA